MSSKTHGILQMLPQPSHYMPARPDIVVYSQDKRRVLVVEVKEGKEPDPEHTAGLRRTLIAHDLLPHAPFFLLAYRTRLFLWRQETKPGEPPDYSASAAPILDDYASSFLKAGSPLRESGLQLIIFAWLADLASGARVPHPDSEPDRMSVESGLWGDIRLGDVQFEADT
ncbi:MAG TPA: hypothetical protein VFS52_05420 [Steroidobacteraceae bacterium]|nr:hypothetical protein [Steroidobacteraceae bacterium]